MSTDAVDSCTKAAQEGDSQALIQHKESGGECPRQSGQSPVEDGITIEMGEDNDICINATYLKVQCDNSFLMSGQGGNGQRVSARTRSAAVEGKRSALIIQHDAALPSRTRKSDWSRYFGALLLGTAALKLAKRVFTWHRVRHRTHRALTQSSVPDILTILAQPDLRSSLAALTHISLDLQNASNRRLRSAALEPFPPVSDFELSRASAARARSVSNQQTAQTRATRPESSLSISSVDTTPSCRSSVACMQTTPEATHPAPASSASAPDLGDAARLSQPTEAVQSGNMMSDRAWADKRTSDNCIKNSDAALSSDNMEPPISSTASSADGRAGEDEGCMSVVACHSAGNIALGMQERRRLVCKPEPLGGYALHMLTTNNAVWEAFESLIKRHLCSSNLQAVRVAAWSTQVVAFASERLTQRLVDAGLVPILLSCMVDSFGVRIRSGGARLRQPGAAPPSVPAASSVLSLSPLNLPTLHFDWKRRMLSVSPHGVNWGFLNIIPRFGWALQRQLSPRCRAITAKRQASAEALQNIAALRSGAQALLKHEQGLDILCSSVYTLTPIGRAAAVETAYSCMLHYPRSRGRVYNVGFDHALGHALERSRSSVLVEVVMRAYTRLGADRGDLVADSSDCSMFV